MAELSVADRVPRRLLDMMDGLGRARAAVISGPPGFGRRRLVDAWLAAAEQRHGITVEPTWGPGDIKEQLDSVNTTFQTVVLVCDERVNQNEDLVNAVLDATQSRQWVKVIFHGVSRPKAPLGKLAAQGFLIDIDATDLAYTRAEVADILARENPAAGEDVVDFAMRSCNGWPVFISLLLQMNTATNYRVRVGRMMDAYITEEVWPLVGPDDIELVEILSLVGGLEPHGAVMLTGRSDAAAQFSRMQAQGLPLIWDDRNTIVMNPALQAFGRRRLEVHDPDHLTDLVRRVVLWRRNTGDVIKAAKTATHFHQEMLAWTIGGEFILSNLYRPGLSEFLDEYSELVRPTWELDLARSIANLVDTPDTLLAQIHGFDEHWIEPGNHIGRAWYVVFMFGILRLCGYPAVDTSQAEAVAATLDEMTLDDNLLPYTACALTEYGLWLLHQDRLYEAQDVLMRAVGVSRIAMVAWSTVLAIGGLSAMHAIQGSVTTAGRLAEECLSVLEAHPMTLESLDEYALLANALAASEAGEVEACRSLIKKVQTRPHQLLELDGIKTFLIASSMNQSNDPDGALRTIRAFREDPQRPQVPSHVGLLCVAAVDAHLAKGEVGEALREATEMSDLGLHDSLGWSEMLTSIAVIASGDVRNGYQRLHAWSEVAEGAEGNNVDAPRLRVHAYLALANVAAQLGDQESSIAFIARGRSLAERSGLSMPVIRDPRAKSISQLEASLTQAEKHVLLHLESSRTLPETAQALFISQNTLKTHLRRIYTKLGVQGKEQAVEQARLMGIQNAS